MTRGQEQFNAYAARTVYQETTEFNGRAAKKGRQALTVVRGLAIQHDATFPNQNIIARVLLAGKNGAEYDGFVMREGRITVNYSLSDMPA